MFNKKQLGVWGEKLAADYLKNKGYKIIDKNFQTREGEIDIICEKENSIIFVEVKLRTNKIFGYPEESVTAKKIDRLIATAQTYLRKNNLDCDWQIDVISILYQKNCLNINHLYDITKI